MKIDERYNLSHVENGNKYAKELNFKCPYYTNDRSCTGCKIAKHGTWNDETKSWSYTGTCTEWQKKHWPGACGCGGYYECECGFKEWFCIEIGRIYCPFCGKLVKKILTGMTIQGVLK